MGKYRRPHVGQTALRHQHGEILVRERRHGLADQGGEEQQHDILQTPKILAGDVSVDTNLH